MTTVLSQACRKAESKFFTNVQLLVLWTVSITQVLCRAEALLFASCEACKLNGGQMHYLQGLLTSENSSSLLPQSLARGTKYFNMAN